MRDVQGTVYVLHFAMPISPKHTTQHYVGWAADVDARIKEHRAGRGARLTEVAAERGIEFTVVATFQGTRHLERAMKDKHNTKKLFCPVCRDAH